MASEDIYPDFDNYYNDEPEDRQPEMGDSHYDNYKGRMSDFDGNMDESWGDENLVNKLKNRIADLEEKLEDCTGPDFSNVSNRFHNIPRREI
jgi:hypothetical protein